MRFLKVKLTKLALSPTVITRLVPPVITRLVRVIHSKNAAPWITRIKRVMTIAAVGLACLAPSAANAQSCTYPDGEAGTLYFNDDKKVMQFCNGSEWTAIGPSACGNASCGGSENERVVFTTNGAYQPQALGSVSGADAICQANADAAGLKGTYLAWIADSDPASAPATRFDQSTVPYVRVDGAQVAPDWAGLIDGDLDNTLDITAYGGALSTTKAFTSNVNNDGTQASTTNHCSNLSGTALNISSGRIDQTNSTWSDSGGWSCSASARLLCFEQDSAADTNCAAPTTNLLSHWTLNETIGINAADSGSLGNDGTMQSTLNGADDTVPGKYATALNFNGAGDYILVPDETDYDFAGPFTVSAWIKVSSFTKTYQAIITKGDSAWRLSRYAATDFVHFNTAASTPNGTTGSIAVNDGLWHHVVGVYDGTNNYLYVDGVLDATTAPSIPLGVNDEPVRIGANYTGGTVSRQFAGDIDDVRIYDRALSPQEVAALYGGTGGTCTISACDAPFGLDGEMLFNTDVNVMQYCNGSNWVAMGPPSDGGGGGCSAPDGLQAELRYNSDFNALQYCEGDEWVAVGGVSDIETVGLLAHWKLDETGGADIGDATGNGYDGDWTDGGDNVISGADSVAGARNTALQSTRVDGTGILIDGMNVTATDASLSGWANITDMDASGGVIVSIHNSMWLEAHDTYVEGGFYDGSAWRRTQHTINIKNAGWFHYAFTLDAVTNTQKLYLNGALVATTNYADPIDWQTSVRSSIGRHPTSTNFDLEGIIDDVRLYDRVLSAADVQALYN